MTDIFHKKSFVENSIETYLKEVWKILLRVSWKASLLHSLWNTCHSGNQAENHSPSFRSALVNQLTHSAITCRCWFEKSSFQLNAKHCNRCHRVVLYRSTRNITTIHIAIDSIKSTKKLPSLHHAILPSFSKVSMP